MKSEISILNRLVNSLFEGHVDDDTVLFVLNTAPELDSTDELQVMKYVFTCSASIAQLTQRYHTGQVLKPFFEELGKVIARIDDFMEIHEDASVESKIEVLDGLRDLPIKYGHVIAADADVSTLESACADLVVQSAINGMLLSIIEKID